MIRFGTIRAMATRSGVDVLILFSIRASLARSLLQPLSISASTVNSNRSPFSKCCWAALSLHETSHRQVCESAPTTLSSGIRNGPDYSRSKSMSLWPQSLGSLASTAWYVHLKGPHCQGQTIRDKPWQSLPIKHSPLAKLASALMCFCKLIVLMIDIEAEDITAAEIGNASAAKEEFSYIGRFSQGFG